VSSGHAKFASGWEGTVRVEECEPPHRLLLRTVPEDESDRGFEVSLTAVGAGDQIHVEDLAAYLAGNDRCDARARWEALHPGYLQLAADIA
jgi:hypothetical protein